VLGAEPVRPIDLAAFYAAIANEGMRPVPYVVESIDRDGARIYQHRPASVAINSVDHAAFYQLKSMMQGVLARGTARSIANLAPYVAGKTGTSDNENDAWFVGFSNEVTVAVWLGYDNADKRRTLGGGATGGGVAVPIFEPVIEAVWAHVTQDGTRAAFGRGEAASFVHIGRRRHQRVPAERCQRQDRRYPVPPDLARARLRETRAGR
jgi:penicillin-binding protein 1A